jgi:competence protein ComEA
MPTFVHPADLRHDGNADCFFRNLTYLLLQEVFMLKKLLAIIAFLFYAATAFAANVDANTASAADLDAVKGIGPAISGRIIDARKQGPFKDWNDFIARVKGIGNKNAAKFSAQGLTVSGAPYSGAPATSAAQPARTHKAASTAAADSPAAAPAAQAPQAEASAPPKHGAHKAKKAAAAASAAQ